VVIKASSRRQIDALLQDLRSERPSVRESAIARLTVIGARAVERLAHLAADPAEEATARAAAFKALEAQDDPRGLDAAHAVLMDPDPAVAVAAVAVAGTFVRGPLGVRAVDCLTSLALDTTRAEPVRLAAAQALTQLGPASLRPIFERLAGDPTPSIAAFARDRGRASDVPRDATRVLTGAAAGVLPDDPQVLRQALAAPPHELALSVLQQIIDVIREREGAGARPGRSGWDLARAAAHAALARRGSRLALYDLREWLAQARAPLPLDVVVALMGVGDRSCLEAVAAAYARADPSEDWWRGRLADAFRAIAGRERVTRRHALVMKIERRWPEALHVLWPAGAAPRRPRRAAQ
jgi:hypothetical protein